MTEKSCGQSGHRTQDLFRSFSRVDDRPHSPNGLSSIQRKHIPSNRSGQLSVLRRFQALATDSFRMRGNPFHRTCSRMNGWSERRIAKYHSYRRATIGSTWEARRAGRKPASVATTASRVAANRMATGSAKPSPNSMLRMK